MVSTELSTMAAMGQKYSEKVFHVHTPSIVHGALVGAALLWASLKVGGGL
jgi:hypothetical protein